MSAPATVSTEALALDRALEAIDADPAPVRRALTDAFSVALAGRTHDVVRNLSAQLGMSGDEATLWSSSNKTDAQSAALLNGAAIHSFDFDDTHDAAIVHAMSVILPAALVGAELGGRDDTLVGAVAAGTELACNVALAAGHYGGWHYTTLCGTFGAALACGVAMGLERPVLEAALGNAYVFAAGNKQAVLESSLMKRLMPGFAARNAVLAVKAAQSGLGDVDRWLEGDFGLFELFYEGDARPVAVRGGERFRIEELSFKPIPACRFTHGAVEAAVKLREQLGPHEIETAHITVRYPALDRFGIVCRPFETRGAPEMDAQFSTAYLVAEALRSGGISFASYTSQALADPVTADLAQRVTVERCLPVDDPRALGPIEVSVGTHTERVEEVLGSPQRPMSHQEQRQKFLLCAGKALGRDASQVDPSLWTGLQDSVDSLGRSGSLDGVLSALARMATDSR
jgi:2-methylcitrate dehydratase PrpD